jgi:hypothetical protein
MTFSPTICLDFGGFGTVIVIAFLAYIAGYWHHRIKSDRFETIDQTKRDVAAWQANYGLALGEPVLISRPDAEATIFRRHAYRNDPSVNYLEQLAA